MLLTRRARQQGAPAVPVAPSAGERAQPAADHVAGEVLLRDASLGRGPALAEVVQEGQDHPAEGGVEVQRSEGAVESGLRRGLVEGREGAVEIVEEHLGGRRGPVDSPRATLAASAAERPAAIWRCISPTRRSSSSE